MISVGVLAFCQCRPSNTHALSEEQCEQMNAKTAELINDYTIIDENRLSARLDSALVLIDSMLKCNCKVSFKAKAAIRKVYILCTKKEYAEALKFTQATSDTLFIEPYMKYVYEKRIEAMMAQEQNDMATRNKLIHDIVIYLQNYLPIPSPAIDSVLALKDRHDIGRYEKNFAISQYYYYRAQIEGKDKILKELDSLQQRINGNQEFFDYFLREPIKYDKFMNFNGV